MKHRRVFFLVVFCLLISVFPAAAQGGSPLVAFVNSGGQLIVSSGDGSFRWIVTNPGASLTGEVTWFGNQLLFAVGGGSASTLQIADVDSQTVSEIGTVPGTALSISSDGDYLFYQQGDGSYAVQAFDGSSAFALPVSGDYGAQDTGLWSDAAPLIAYWGYAGNSTLAVTDAASGETVTLDSGRSTPITPLAWLPGTAELIYRDASGFVRSADVSCLQNGCGVNPLESGIALLPADAASVQTDGDWVYYLSGGAVAAVNLSCVRSDTCLDSAVQIAGSAAPQTALSVQRNILVYTGYTSSANNINDREVRVLDLGCLGNPSSCAPQAILSGATAGALSSSGRFVVIEPIGGGLSSLDLATGTISPLADGRVSLAGARWQ